jgi:micrococcal nuclease
MALRSQGARKLVLFIFLFVAAAGLLWRIVEPLGSGTATAAEAVGGSAARVVRVIDGDTLVVRLGSQEERVRLLGVDTPEMPRRGWAGEYWAGEATAFVRGLLPEGSAVTLRRDPQRKERDSYDRLLCYVELADGRLLNAELIRSGHGYAFTRYPFLHEEAFVQYEAAARDAGLGVWADAGSAALRWNAEQGVEPLRLHPMGNRSWAIECDGYLKPHVRPGALAHELSKLRRIVERTSGREREQALGEEGYRR